MITYVTIGIITFAVFFVLSNQSIRQMLMDLYLRRKIRKEGMVKLGDAVKSGDYIGEVIGFKPFFIQVQTTEGTVTVPYRLVVKDSFKKFHTGKLYACVNNDAEIQYVECLMAEIALLVPLIMKVPKPRTKLSHISDSGLVFEVTYWCKFPNKESFVLEHFEKAAREQFKFQGIEPGNEKGVFIKDIGLENE